MLSLKEWKEELKKEDVELTGGPVDRPYSAILDLYFIYRKHNKGK